MSLPQRVVGRSLSEWGRSSKRVRCVSPGRSSAILPVLPSHALRCATTLRSYWAASTTSSIPPVPEDSAELDAAGRSVSGCTRAIPQVLPKAQAKKRRRERKLELTLKVVRPAPPRPRVLASLPRSSASSPPMLHAILRLALSFVV